MKAILTVGISNSGKSLWAEEKCRKDGNWWNINRDDLRFMVKGASNWNEYKFNKKIEYMINQLQTSFFTEAFDNKKNIIISDTNLNAKTRRDLFDELEEIGFRVELKEFPIDYDTALKRERSNHKGVGGAVIYKQYKQWLKYTGRKTYEADTSSPKAVIFDVDGTLAQMQGRKPFDWDRVSEDSVRSCVALMTDMFVSQKYKVIVMSGRDGVCFGDTEQWLKDHNIPFDLLLMREANDSRKDSIIKEELFWDNVAPNYNVVAVVDDRPQMIRAWHEIGIKNVFAVADPYEEF